MLGSCTPVVLDLNTSGVDGFIRALKKELARVNKETLAVYTKWATTIHADIVRLTPQWGGNLAASWYLDIGAPSSGAQELGDPSVRKFDSPGTGRQPYSRGLDPAVSISLARGKKFKIPALTAKVFIHNPVSYADEVEADSGPNPIRAVNRVPRSETGKVAMVYHAHTKYSLTGLYQL